MIEDEKYVFWIVFLHPSTSVCLSYERRKIALLTSTHCCICHGYLLVDEKQMEQHTWERRKQACVRKNELFFFQCLSICLSLIWVRTINYCVMSVLISWCMCEHHHHCIKYIDIGYSILYRINYYFSILHTEFI